MLLSLINLVFFSYSHSNSWSLLVALMLLFHVKQSTITLVAEWKLSSQQDHKVCIVPQEYMGWVSNEDDVKPSFPGLRIVGIKNSNKGVFVSATTRSMVFPEEFIEVAVSNYKRAYNDSIIAKNKTVIYTYLFCIRRPKIGPESLPLVVWKRCFKFYE